MSRKPPLSPIDTSHAAVRDSIDSHLRKCLSFMSEMETSLAGSRKALGALDLAGIEQGTSDQTGLIANFGKAFCQRCLEGGTHGDRHDSTAASDEIVRELRQSQSRLLQAARLQAALLARVQRKTRVLANLLTGTDGFYSPPVRLGERVGKRAGAQPCQV
jgi:hypothetical protein